MPRHHAGDVSRADALVTETDPRSPAAEAYRTLRTNIRFAGLDNPCRTIVVTSAGPGEGKTTTAANFAVVAAQSDARVCLVDADLRRPALHKIFGVTNDTGLTTALLEGRTFSSVAQPTRVPNLVIVPSGPHAPNPAELVGSHRMHDCIVGAVKEFDLVVFDSPPVISVADALALSAQVDGVLLVVHAGKMPHAVVRRTSEQIEAVKGRILGIVLNSVDLKRDGYYYDYYRYYGAPEPTS